MLVEAWISFGHFPGWKGQLAVREKLAAAVVEDQPAESQRWTDQDRRLVSYYYFFHLAIKYPSLVAVTNKQLFAGLNTNTFPISTGKCILGFNGKQILCLKGLSEKKCVKI